MVQLPWQKHGDAPLLSLTLSYVLPELGVPASKQAGERQSEEAEEDDGHGQEAEQPVERRDGRRPGLRSGGVSRGLPIAVRAMWERHYQEVSPEALRCPAGSREGGGSGGGGWGGRPTSAERWGQW
jgi:hypothetical protein